MRFFNRDIIFNVKTSSVFYYSLLSSLLFFALFFSFHSSATAAAVACNKLGPNAAIPAGFGASFNLFSTAREFLLSGTCDTVSDAITVGTVSAGNGNPNTYVYNKGYRWNGTSWIPYTLTCLGQTVSGVWCVGKGTTSFTLSQNPTNIIAYTCQWNGTKWNCGCRDNACTTNYWQIQKLEYQQTTPPPITPPPGGQVGASGKGKPAWAGIWGIWGGEDYKFPWLKGSLITCTWAQIEPSENNLDYSCLDRKISQAISNNQSIMFLIYIGNPPQWVYNTVPKVITVDGSAYPYYLDSDFRKYVPRMWLAVLKHIASLPADQKKVFVGVQVPLGKSGDEQPYDSAAVNPNYAINSGGTEWGNYQREMITAFVNALKTAGLNLIPMFKVQQQNYDWMKAQGIVHMRKTVYVAQMYQLNNEMNLDWVRDDLFELSGSDYTRARGEFDAPVASDAGWLSEAPIWHYYWQSLWMLNYGVDMFNQRTQTLSKGNNYAYAFTFFTNHAGYKDPKTSRYAFVALRDGLDVADTARFPTAQYGALSGANSPTRYQKIAQAMAPFGAKQGDVAHQAVTGLAYSTQLNATNDVAYNIWRGNYAMYIDQIDPNGTSQGYWRVGSTNEPFGRYARGFNGSKNMNRMYFDIDDKMFSSGGLSGNENVDIRVVYFDKGTGTWSLNYDAVGNPDKVAYQLTKTNTNAWKEKTITVTDANFNNKGPRASDISLVNTDGNDDIFHMVEVIFTER